MYERVPGRYTANCSTMANSRIASKSLILLFVQEIRLFGHLHASMLALDAQKSLGAPTKSSYTSSPASLYQTTTISTT
jgi:hypothetical protein